MNESLEAAGVLLIYKYLVGDIAIFPSEKSKEKLFKACSLLEIGEAKKALEQVNISMEIDTPKGLHYLIKGYILYELEDFEGAIENFENSLKLADNFTSLHIVGTQIEMDLEIKVDTYF